MEARQITIVSSRTQQKKVITSAATTRGELKADLRDNGIDFDGMAFFEGISKTELKDDASILPHDLPWKGQVTNDLVIMLTEPQKKIRNGAGVTNRAEAYSYIKAKGLGAEVEKKYGQNFTRCKTPDLIDFCNKHMSKSAPKAAPAKKAPAKAPSKPAKPAAKPVAKKKPVKATSTKVETPSTAAETAEDAYINHDQLVALLVKKNIISMAEATSGEKEAPTSVDFSDSDIKNMFRNMK